MKQLIFLCFCLFFCWGACSDDTRKLPPWEWDDPEVIPVSERPRLVWIDASANFRYFANSKENIEYYLDKAVEAGFQEIIVDVRPTSGDVLFRSDLVEQVKELQGTVRTETWDYLGCFLEEGHKRGLRVHAALNTFVGGNTSHGGVVYRESKMADLLTQMYYPTGTVSILHDTRSSAKFFNPADERVQQYVGDLLKEVATNYPTLDGIVLDRARFNSIESDFSETSRKAFESFLGYSLSRFPEDIFTWNAQGQVVEGTYYRKWLEFRAKVIHDFFEKTRRELKSIRPALSFGSYTGSWYSTYYNEGVNWASKQYDASRYYSWATPEYKNYGYADLLDLYMTGAYGTTIYGSSNEWTVQGAILHAKEIVKGDVGVCGSLYGLNFHNAPKDCEEAVYVALTTGDGLMFFDIIYLIMYDQWSNVKAGIERALATEKK